MKHFLNEIEKLEKDRNSCDVGVPMKMTGEGSNISIREKRASK